MSKKNNPQPPIIVSTCSHSSLKMGAIRDLAEAVKKLSEALASSHTKVDIRDCQIVGAPTGITVENVE